MAGNLGGLATLLLVACLACGAFGHAGNSTNTIRSLLADTGSAQSSSSQPPPPPEEPPVQLQSLRLRPRRGRVPQGKRLFLSPCENVVSSRAACRRRCSKNRDCEGWHFTRPFDCSHAGLGSSVGVCYMLEDFYDSYRAWDSEHFANWAGWDA